MAAALAQNMTEEQQKELQAQLAGMDGGAAQPTATAAAATPAAAGADVSP